MARKKYWKLVILNYTKFEKMNEIYWVHLNLRMNESQKSWKTEFHSFLKPDDQLEL